jgi:hypothetical protein
MFAFGFPFLAQCIKWANGLPFWSPIVPFLAIDANGSAGTDHFSAPPAIHYRGHLRRIGPSSSPPSHRPHTEGPNVSPSVTGVLGGRRKATSVGTGGDAPSHPRPHFYSPSSVQLFPQMMTITPPAPPSCRRQRRPRWGEAPVRIVDCLACVHDAYKSRCLPYCKNG